MKKFLFLSLLLSGVLAAQTQDSLLSGFFDPEMKFAEGCGCYLRRPDAAKSDGLTFFGKLGDRKESGWIALRGKVTEVPKERPDINRVENGKTVRIQSYRSSEVTIQVELIQEQVKKGEEGSPCAGEITVSSGGLTEKTKVTGFCGC